MEWTRGVAADTHVWRLLILIIYTQALVTWGTPCRFPEFLWQLADNSTTQRTWFTEVEYASSSTVWVRRKQVVGRHDQIVLTPQFPGLCQAEDGERKPCITNENPVTLSCLESEGHGKYRVTHTGSGYLKYTCLRIVRRNSNVVQVWTAKTEDKNLDGLCNDESLIRNEWPWIADVITGWSPCPLVGGYGFRALVNEKKKRLCYRIWRPSRLESECIPGEGMQFSFPEKTCSFFGGRELEKTLQCWATWDEEFFTFVIASDGANRPQFVLRFPHERDVDRLTVHMFFSPVCPVDRRGIPPGNIMHVDMRMHRSESGSCYDESPSCAQYSREGKCRNTDLHQYGNHCKRSCGLCELVPSSSAECDFPLNYQGEWVFFESDRKETVRISGGKIEFSQLGTFICKSKHWSEEQYKFLSVFYNGCHPRYTCMDFEYDYDQRVLKFRVSKSSLIDRSFDLCSFQDDQFPLGDRIRSSAFKVMYPISSVWQGSCGLGGLIKFQATFADGQSCGGTLSDWNPFSCAITSKMAMQFRSCKDGLAQAHRDFTCEAYINMGGTSRALITRETVESQADRYACWIVEQDRMNSTEGPPGRRWRRAYMLTTAQCGLEADFNPQIYKPNEIAFQIYQAPVEKDCILIQKGSTPHSSTIKYTRKSTKVLRPGTKQSVKAEASKTSTSSASAIWRTASVLFLLHCLTSLAAIVVLEPR